MLVKIEIIPVVQTTSYQVDSFLGNNVYRMIFIIISGPLRSLASTEVGCTQHCYAICTNSYDYTAHYVPVPDQDSS